jgi:uncharacterized RDD family membrane protein YckC
MSGAIFHKALGKEEGHFPQEGMNSQGISPGLENSQQVSNRLTLGGFFRRSSAFFLDLSVVFIICLFFLWLSISAVRLAYFGQDLTGQMGAFQKSFLFTVFLLWPALFLFYFSFFTYWGGQTPGKKIFGLRIIAQSGGKISPIQALGRSLGYFLSFLTGGWGFWLVLFSSKRRSLHDWISRTRVVRLL